MAFIRRVRTALGATAVQIAEYASRRQRIVKHVGSAHTDAELGLLLEQARSLLADPGQDTLDLGVDPAPWVAELVVETAAQGVLNLAPRSVVERRDEPGRVVSTDSRFLHETLAAVFDSLGFDVLDDPVFRDLVIARIVEPTSLLDTGRVLKDLGRTPPSYATMKRTLARAQAKTKTGAKKGGGYRDQIATACFTHAATRGDISLILYDVTTLYFEADKEDDLPKVGYSKQRRVDPQIVVGLLVDRRGFPLEIGCFEGNKTETLTIIPIVKQFQARHGLADIVIVTDTGMLSASNLRDLDNAALRFIVGSRVTKAPIDLESHFRWHGDAFTDAQLIDTITPRSGHHKDATSDPQAKAEPAWDPEAHPGSRRAVWAYSTKRTVRDNKTLTHQENRARAAIAGEKTARTPQFVKTRNGVADLDKASLARAQRLIGLKGYVTNIPKSLKPASEVTASYHALWQVEQSSRMPKTDLHARPMSHHTRDAIKTHLTIVFTALAVSHKVQTRTGPTIRNVIPQLRPLRSTTIAINDTQQTFTPVIPEQQQTNLDTLEPA